MKIWIRENWFKIGILLLNLVLCFFIIYYFGIFLPSIEKQKISEANQKYIEEQKDKCKKAGEAEYKKEIEEAKKINDSILDWGSDNPGTPTYFYNHGTSICYYVNSKEIFRKFGNNLDIVQYYVKNLGTNAIVLSTEVVFGTNEPRNGQLTLDEFNEQKAILFGLSGLPKIK